MHWRCEEESHTSGAGGVFRFGLEQVKDSGSVGPLTHMSCARRPCWSTMSVGLEASLPAVPAGQHGWGLEVSFFLGASNSLRRPALLDS